MAYTKPKDGSKPVRRQSKMRKALDAAFEERVKHVSRQTGTNPNERGIARVQMVGWYKNLRKMFGPKATRKEILRKYS